MDIETIGGVAAVALAIIARFVICGQLDSYWKRRNLKQLLLPVRCLDCGAAPGTFCMDERGQRINGFHESRVLARTLASDERAGLRSMPCPECDAEPGEPCIGPDGATAAAFHSARVDAGLAYGAVAFENLFCDECDALPGQWCKEDGGIESVMYLHEERLRRGLFFGREVELGEEFLDADFVRIDPARFVGARLRAVQRYGCAACEAPPGEWCTPLQTDEEWMPDAVALFGGECRVLINYGGRVHEPRLENAVRELPFSVG